MRRTTELADVAVAADSSEVSSEKARRYSQVRNRGNVLLDRCVDVELPSIHQSHQAERGKGFRCAADSESRVLRRYRNVVFKIRNAVAE